MNKNTIKKIIFTIIILTVLILSLLFFFRISSEKYNEDIKVSKKIIKTKYDKIKYFDNSYLYAYKEKNNEYIVFDYNGNSLYTFTNKNKLNIISVSKKYFITKEDKYYLYNSNNEEITSGNNIYYISDYMVFVDNNIINVEGETIFNNVSKIDSYYKSKYFLIDNYFVNEKGKVLLYGYKIEKVKVNENDTDYIIVEKDNKYYSFFPLVNNIIGDGFDKYFEYENNTYILSDNQIYLIYNNGLRKEINFTVDKNINSIDYNNAVRKNRILTIRNYYLGILETDTNKFHKIVKTKKFTYKYLDDSNIIISCDNYNYVYNLDNYEIIYKNKFDNIVIFDNNYKTIKKKDKYYLLDDKDNIISNSSKQIILLNSKVVIGKTNKNIKLYDNKFYDGKTITIYGKKYYKYKNNNLDYIISSDLKEQYISKYVNYMSDTIVKQDNNKLYFYNLKNNKTYEYNLEDYKIENTKINKNELILSNNKNIIILNNKAKEIKRIKNVKLEDIYYNNDKQAIIIIVKKDNKNIGAYVFK